MKKLISVIIPCYNEQEVIEQTYARLLQTELPGCDAEYIFVDDGSRDQTFSILKGFSEKNPAVKVLGFQKNFGHQCAVSAGIAFARGDAAIVIDADLQDPPEVMREMVLRWQEGYKIAYGKRLKRKGESFLKKFTAWGYYRFLRMLGGGYIPKDTGDFRLIDRDVMDFLNALPERNRFLRGLTAWAGFSSCPVEYVRDERAAGETKYTLKKMFRLAGDGITAFSDKPLKLPMYTGAFLLILSLLYFAAAVVLTILGILSYMHIILALAFLFIGFVLLSLGVMGLYISRMYDELKGRPMYLIDKKLNLEER